MTENSNRGLSIIICCYNSKDLLEPTLKHLSLQKIPYNLDIELIIVDNNSSDGTASLAKKTWEGFNMPFPMHVYPEQKPGLIYAREKGFSKAQYDIICFVDDDNWLNENYIQLGYEIITSKKEIGILGGKGEMVSSIKPPNWLKDFESSYAVGAQSDKSGDVSQKKGYVYGAGMFMKAKVWSEVKATGYRSYLTGRKANIQSSGEEVEFSYIAKYLGYKIYYDERLVFKHYIKASRLTWDYLIQRYKGIGISQFYLRVYAYYMSHNSNPSKKLRFPIWLDRAIMAFKLLMKNKFKFLLANFKDTTADQEVLQSISYWNELKTYFINRNELNEVYSELCALKQKIK